MILIKTILDLENYFWFRKLFLIKHQIIALTAKLTNLKYYVLIAYLDQNNRFLSYTEFWYLNIILWKLFKSRFYRMIRFLRVYIFEILLKFIDDIRMTLDSASSMSLLVPNWTKVYLLCFKNDTYMRYLTIKCINAWLYDLVSCFFVIRNHNQVCI